MNNNSLFIVIEGLDGSGKTTISRQLVSCLETVFSKKVKQTFEPHDASCAGLFIRQVLEKKILQFSPETLTYAFAANRLDHCDREINPWLEKTDHILICDRYYLSSLVYQSSKNHPFEYVMQVNQFARKPDLIFFFNVSNEVCYQRMLHRNKPQELFEKNLSETRAKYFSAIGFLRTTRDENIIEIDANGTLQEVFDQLIEQLILLKKESWNEAQCLQLRSYKIQPENTFEITNNVSNSLENILNSFPHAPSPDIIHAHFTNLKHTDQAIIFLKILGQQGYHPGAKFARLPTQAFELTYNLPGGIVLQGGALILDSPLQYGTILESISVIEKMIHFLFVYVPGNPEAVNQYYERDLIQFSNGLNAIFPNIKIITEADIVNTLFKLTN